MNIRYLSSVYLAPQMPYYIAQDAVNPIMRIAQSQNPVASCQKKSLYLRHGFGTVDL